MNFSESTDAFIIAGGKSRRFGSDKARYLFHDKPLIKHVFDAIYPVFKDITIISSRQYASQGSLINGVNVIFDIIPDLGPIGGIYTALKTTNKGRVFVAGCDMPFINSSFLRYIAGIEGEYDIVIPAFDDKLEPLHAIYSTACIPILEKFLHKGRTKIIDFFSDLIVRKVEYEEILLYDSPEKMFRNINYLEDAQKFENS